MTASTFRQRGWKKGRCARRLLCTTLVLALSTVGLVTSCGTATRVVKKTVWFTVGTTGKIVAKTVKLGTKVAWKGVDAGLNLLKDRDTRRHAANRAESVVKLFWLSTQSGRYEQAYKLLCPTLRDVLPMEEFIAQATQWASRLRDFRTLDAVVYKEWVQVPTRLVVDTEKRPTTVNVGVAVSRFDGEWKIAGWELSDQATEVLTAPPPAEQQESDESEKQKQQE